MAKSATTAPAQLKKGSKVVATTDLRDVPEGTEGKVTMVTGLTWIRYWVRFGNGVSLGTVPRHKLATPDEWRRKDEVVEDDGDGGGDDDGGAVEAAADEGGGATTANGTFVRQLHLDRAKAALERLGVTR